MKKTVTPSEIQATAIVLIARDGQTTTLDVKTFLRSQGFFVTQSEVSSALDELASNGNDVTWTSNGNYRIYSKAVVSTTDEIDEDEIEDEDEVEDETPLVQTQPVQTQQTNSTSGRIKVNVTPLCENANGLSVSDLLDQFELDDMVAYSGVSSNLTPTKIYPAGTSRDHVRSHYARTVQMDIADVRACRLSNFVK